MVKKMFCTSVNHKTCETGVREKFALTEEAQNDMIEQLKMCESVEGAVILMTCNRSEIYYCGTAAAGAAVEKEYVRHADVSRELFRSCTMRYEGEEALMHLYRVVCGLDSAVLGEVEIIRQVKLAYQKSLSGDFVNADLNIIFQGALQFAGEMADRSAMTRLPVSVGTLATGAVLDFCQKIDRPQILLVGASGEIGGIVLKDLLDASDRVQITGTSRRHRPGLDYADTTQVRFVHYDSRYAYVRDADVIISATSSPHYTFLADRVLEEIQTDKKDRLFLDLAMPRDIDDELDGRAGCQVKNLDHIKALARENNSKKLSEAKKIGLLLKERVDEIGKRIRMQHFYSDHGDIMEELGKRNASWLLYRLRDHLSGRMFEEVLNSLKED